MLASTFIRDLETFRRRRLVHLRRFHNELLLGGAAGSPPQEPDFTTTTTEKGEQLTCTTIDYRYLGDDTEPVLEKLKSYCRHNAYWYFMETPMQGDTTALLCAYPMDIDELKRAVRNILKDLFRDLPDSEFNVIMSRIIYKKPPEDIKVKYKPTEGIGI